MPNWWLPTGITASDVVCAYKAEGASSLAASYSNINNPGTQDAIAIVPPTWDAVNGWKFNGNDQYLDTGTEPASTWSVICKYSDVLVNNTGNLFGISLFSPETRYLSYQPISNSNEHKYGMQSSIISVMGIGNPLSGIVSIAGNQGYLNGLPDGEPATPVSYSGTTGKYLYIGCLNFNGGGLVWTPIDAYIQSFALYNKTLTGTQIAEVTTNIQNGYTTPSSSVITRRRKKIGLLL